MRTKSNATYLDYSQALCAQTDPELFFPEKGGSVKLAKQICEACPVKSDCLLEALSKGYRDGIWGGLAPRERAQLARAGNSPIKFNPIRRGRGRPRTSESD